METPEADRGKPPREAAGRAEGLTVVAANPRRDLEQYAVLAVFVLLTLGCYLVVRPFLTAFLWGAIIAVSNRGLYQRFVRLVRGREKFAATLFGLFLVAILFVPISFFAVRLAAGAPALIARVDEMLSGGLRQPPAWLGSIPLVGKGALEWWQAVSADPERIRQELRPLAKPIREFLVAAGAGIGGMLAFGFLGLFIGPTILTVVYNLFQEWMATLKAPDSVVAPRPQA